MGASQSRTSRSSGSRGSRGSRGSSGSSGSRSRHQKDHSWKEDAPNKKERIVMLKKCGRKCFLGSGTSFPVCTCGTCDINRRGVQSAYSRAREWASITARKKRNSTNARTHHEYVKVADRAKRLLKQMNRTTRSGDRSGTRSGTRSRHGS